MINNNITIISRKDNEIIINLSDIDSIISKKENNEIKSDITFKSGKILTLKLSYSEYNGLVKDIIYLNKSINGSNIPGKINSLAQYLQGNKFINNKNNDD